MSAPVPVYRGLINDPATQVVESIDGMLLGSPHLQKLDGGRDVKVVLRSDWMSPDSKIPSSQVALISGGGDGHAPAHSGFVGAGMLTGAVSGEVFASPSVKAVLAGIRAVANRGHAGANAPNPVLLIVKNYTGDRLNFGLALSQAALEGISCQMVIVSDDVTLPRSKGVTGRRGIAGTVLVHKIAGYAAAQGKSLSEVAALASQAARSIVSIGVATSACNVPGASLDLSARLPAGKAERGMGIHNEAGGVQFDLRPAKEIVAGMVEALLSRSEQHDYYWREDVSQSQRAAASGEEIVLMVNNLGAATATEMNIFTAETVSLLTSAAYGFRIRRLLVGTFMTALDMKGISLSIMRLDAKNSAWQLEALDSAVGAAGWNVPVVKDPSAPASIPVPSTPAAASSATSGSSATLSQETISTIVKLVPSLAEIILANSAQLNTLDAKAGDGDCGTTLGLGASAVLGCVKSGALENALKTRGLAGLWQLLSQSVAESMGGSSGAILQILFTAAAAEATHSSASSSSSSSASTFPVASQLTQSLLAGTNSVSQFGGAVAGDRTLLDSLLPALDALRTNLSKQSTVSGLAAAAAEAATKGAESTKGMVGRAGRANYVSGDALNDKDPGAEAVALIFQTALKHLQ